MGDRRFSYAAKSGAVVRHARLDWKRERTRSRENRPRAEQRADIPAACRNSARHARVVQITAARSASEVARRSYERARGGSSRRMEKTKCAVIVSVANDLSYSCDVFRICEVPR